MRSYAIGKRVIILGALRGDNRRPGNGTTTAAGLAGKHNHGGLDRRGGEEEPMLGRRQDMNPLRQPFWRLPAGVTRGLWDYVHSDVIADDYDNYFAYNRLFDLDMQVVEGRIATSSRADRRRRRSWVRDRSGLDSAGPSRRPRPGR